MRLPSYLVFVCFCCAFLVESIHAFDHSLYNQILRERVKHGLVDYSSLKTDTRLDRYLKQLEQADLSELSNRDAQLAFWINAYNAYTLKLVVDAYPVYSIALIDAVGSSTKSKEEAEPWKIRFAKVGGTVYTLDEIEHEILRKKLFDPRIHLAIACAAQSCPLLRGEAYSADALDKQLEAQGRWFFDWRNRFDIDRKEAGLSKILEWYAQDFGENQQEVLMFAANYLPDSIARSLREHGSKWKINYFNYDWRLNDQNRMPAK